MQWKPIAKISKSVVKSEFHLLSCVVLCACHNGKSKTKKTKHQTQTKKNKGCLTYSAALVEPALLSLLATLKLRLAKAPQGL